MMNNLILIGMPGAGKSTVGILCAKMLKMDFIDTDLLIQKRTGELLWKTIERCGIGNFLLLEEEVILQHTFQNSVIATGGSVVLGSKAMKYLKEIGCVVFLDVSLHELQKRIDNFATRGIAAEPTKSLNDLYLERLPLYQKYADITVNCSGYSLELTAQAVLSALEDKRKIR